MTLTNYGAVAREVVEAYRDDLMAHPVGTGPYRLTSWRRSSRIVLGRNPSYRDARFESNPAADDAEAQAWARRFNGRRLPLNDGVEISVVQENQPRWLVTTMPIILVLCYALEIALLWHLLP